MKTKLTSNWKDINDVSDVIPGPGVLKSMNNERRLIVKVREANTTEISNPPLSLFFRP